MNTSVRASIDLGTNTCLLLVAEWEPGRTEPDRVLADVSTVVRLGQGVDKNRSLAPDAMERTLACLRKYASRLTELGGDPSTAVCLATSQARDAANGSDFFETVVRETGFRFRVISGDEEARVTFSGGLLPGMDPARSVVVDIGGGSTELISSRGGQSLDMGSVRFTERYLQSDPVTDEQFWNCQAAIDAQLEKLRSWREALGAHADLVAVAGTATAIAAEHLGLEQFDASRIDTAALSRGDIHRIVEELKWRTVKERLELPGMEPGRADVILAGAMILWRTMEVLDFAHCRISTRGLRYGALKI
ncbi:MAG: hypothetical protein A2X94_03725 [Bdellovibrionales bacterium GWB1_55_8]|nr:MAG: hypothetical protein A2X94_03725 [Bdellovibrionales bacterium GWB1_55_8]